MKRDIGGNRLGSGAKMEVHMHGYNRSNHDIGNTWRSTMAAGTLVPFLNRIALPGDDFDLELNCDVMTHPTIGPLFGSYKVQLDIFQTPIRLYQGKLHQNKLNIGMNMANIKLPQVKLKSDMPNVFENVDNSQINPSCIFSYLGVRGLGINYDAEVSEVKREVNAIAYINYFDIGKNYFCNKQEENAYIIHNDFGKILTNFSNGQINTNHSDGTITNVALSLTAGSAATPTPASGIAINKSTYIRYTFDNVDFQTFDYSRVNLLVSYIGVWRWMAANEIFANAVWDEATYSLTLSNPYYTSEDYYAASEYFQLNLNPIDGEIVEPKLKAFPLANIDKMREILLSETMSNVAYVIDDTEIEPYCLPLLSEPNTEEPSRRFRALRSNQEGLLVKTYQSDLFNNWISTEWIDGTNGINEVTKIDVSEGSFTIDELNLSKKVYDMLNRIAVSGGSYDDWIEVTYDHDRYRSQENPAYMGGLSKELVFQEVVSNAATAEQPLGTLAGKGRLSDKHKGGKVKIRVDEPSIIMGIVSLTPRLDYSQGNDWTINLKTMDDFHKPALDGIGYQDLITDQMAWFDTRMNLDGSILFRSAGKQPAWINYMTAVNEVRGNFAEQNDQMWMTLNRRYEPMYFEGGVKLKDLTTYVDPSKFNHVFANTRRDAQNFWVQIRTDIQVRRKMSAKIIPNL